MAGVARWLAVACWVKVEVGCGCGAVFGAGGWFLGGGGWIERMAWAPAWVPAFVRAATPEGGWAGVALGIGAWGGVSGG
ncbi:MAG: hypothetical protein ABSH39_15900 [Candidatus Acidiferrum sp.]